MGLFGKKKQKVVCSCDVTKKEGAAPAALSGGAAVKILGSGCAKCNALEQAVRAALEELGMKTGIDHVTDFAQIAAYGVMTTPALVVNDRVVSSGRVLSREEAKTLIQRSIESD